MIAKLSKSVDKWDQVLTDVEFALNNSVNRSTGEVPSVLLFGVRQMGKINDDLKDILSSFNEAEFGNWDLSQLRDKASKNIEASQSYNEQYYNRRRKHN